MFYSESLLSKTGPLARVWLSANLERKLSKTHILQSNIESSVNAIVDQGTAPMALRLSGQLLLGVVRIYSRKARYLLDDCNEALLKIKMAFRPGNVDLPANLTMPSAAALTVADKISDPMMPELDPSLLDFQPMEIDLGGKKDDPLNWTSQMLSDPLSIEQGRRAAEPRPDIFDEDDMHVELDLDLGDDEGPSVEVGRRAPAPRPFEDSLMDNVDKFQNDNLGLDFGEDEPARRPEESPVPSLIPDNPNEEDHMLLDDGMNDFQMPMDDLTLKFGGEPIAPTDPRLERNSQSPLSSVRSSVVRTFALDEEEADEQTMQQAHKAKKRKVLQADSATSMSNSQIKALQANRDAILRPTNLLPRDPLLLSLMNMQKNGGFVSNILGDGQTKSWAPELRGLLSLDTVRKSGELKRKRDSGVADVDEEENAETDKVTQTQPDIPDDEEQFPAPADSLGEDPLQGPSEPATDGLQPPPLSDIPNPNDQLADRDDDNEISPIRDTFDDTTAPILDPLESGPISIGTQHAVHLLRNRFRTSTSSSTSTTNLDPEPQSPAQLKKAHTLFQDMLPERSTTKADATKMFFEVL
ncbi:MAG: hypothetical protein Q9191_007283, partial [Dirinaria sp. TL-2023a]